MVRDPGKYTPPSPEALFSATQAPLPSSRRFWLRLLSRRPWLLLGSLWLVTVSVAAVASHRLLFTDPGRSAGATPGTSHLTPSSPTTDEEAAATARSRRHLKVTLWGLSSLVGLCALGSVVISQQAKATARRPKRRVRRVRPKAKAPTGPKRLRPYSPQRDGVIVKGAQAVTDTLPLARMDGERETGPATVVPGASPTNTPPPQPPLAPQGSLLPPAADPAGNDAAAPAEVVPQDEAHPLDWTEDSLAHTLDLRQRRSLSSLM